MPTDKSEIDELANAIVDRLKSDCPGCPFGVSPEQADALKNLADGIILSRKTFWETVRKGLVYALLGVIGYGIIFKLAELISKLTNK